jgi:hypothetical protein
MAVLKPLPYKGRGLAEGFIYTLKTFKTSSKIQDWVDATKPNIDDRQISHHK